MVFAKSAGELPCSFLPDVTSTRSFSHQTKIGRSAESPFAEIKGWME